MQYPSKKYPEASYSFGWRGALADATKKSAKKLADEIDKEVLNKMFQDLSKSNGKGGYVTNISMSYISPKSKPRGLNKTKGGKDIVYLIDADTHAYRAAAATDGRYYIVEDGKAHQHKHKYKKVAVSACLNEGLDPKRDISLNFDPEPESYALKILEGSLAEFSGRKVELYVTGNTNFRYDIVSNYKGNRKGRRPENLSACKQHLLNRGAILDSNLEADDLVIIRAKELEKLGIPWVIVGCDKDLKQIEGSFYDPFTKKRVKVSKGEARKNLWKQIATGDSIDNIISPKGLGPKTFDKAYATVDWDTLTDFQALQMMVTLYKTKVKKKDTEGDVQYMARILMWIKTVASLVFLRRGVDEEYQLPTKDGKIIRKRAV